MTNPPIDDLLKAIDDVEEPTPFSPEELPAACVHAASTVARVVDFLDETKSDPFLLGLALSAEQILDVMIQYNESKSQ